jgi:uncharacterized protein DUF5132
MSEDNKQAGALAKTAVTSHHTRNVFFLGAASGLAVAFFAPLFSKQLRPLTRGLVKGGIKMGQQVQKTVVGLKEEFEDIAAEAKAEVDQEQSQGE